MKPAVSPFSTARLTLVIGRVPTRTAAAGGAGLGLRHADAAERRVGEEGVGGQAVGHLAVGAVQQVRGEDLVVVVGGVGEGAAAVALAERPDAGDVGGESVVDRDDAALVRGNARGVEAEVVGVGLAAHGEEDVGAELLGRAFGAVDVHGDAVRRSGAKRMHSAWVRMRTPSSSRMRRTASETSGSSRPMTWRPLLDHRHLGAQAAEGLGELEADVAAADDDEVAGQLFEREHAGVVEGRRRRGRRAGRGGRPARRR